MATYPESELPNQMINKVYCSLRVMNCPKKILKVCIFNEIVVPPYPQFSNPYKIVKNQGTRIGTAVSKSLIHLFQTRKIEHNIFLMFTKTVELTWYRLKTALMNSLLSTEDSIVELIAIF
jgi:hypothetical protein